MDHTVIFHFLSVTVYRCSLSKVIGPPLVFRAIALCPVQGPYFTFVLIRVV